MVRVLGIGNRMKRTGGGSLPTNEDAAAYDPRTKAPRRGIPFSSAALGAILIVILFMIAIVNPHQYQKGSGVVTKTSGSSLRKRSSTDLSQCTVWIAPSSIKGHAGYGIYTTRDLKKGDSIMGYADGLSVSVEELQPHRPWHDVWVEYWWQQNLPDHASYQHPNLVFDFLIGLGTYPNHHCLLGSLTYRFPKPAYNDALVDRFQDPGTGAFSYNMGKEPIVYRPVRANHEIFLDYGYCDREDEYLPQWSDFIVMKRDFDDAINMIKEYDDGARNEIDYDKDGTLVLYKKGVSVYTHELLPQTKDEYDQIIERSKAPRGPSIRMQIAQRSLHERTPEWIQENGICMMNLVPKKSTIPSAGRGAFAQYAFKKGDLITTVPLLQLIDQDFPQKEVLVNYCFRHKHSSMMLCPMSNGALINHCSERTKGCEGGKPNAEYRWASDYWDPTTTRYRKMSWEELKGQHDRGLSFEIVALRDIEPGEEVFFDYGEDWENHWLKHAQEWTPPRPVDGFLTAKQANDGYRPILNEFLSGDLRKEVDHEHLFTGCQYWFDEVDQTYNKDSPLGDWRTLSDDQILARFSEDGEDYSDGTSYSSHESWSYWPCTVVRQEAGSKDLYTVQIHQSPFEQTTAWHLHEVPRILTGYHREGIHYFVKPGKSDQHLPGVFRHSIGIRDEMYPDEWKDLL